MDKPTQVAIADAIAAKLGERQGAGHHKSKPGNISGFAETGETRDIAAAKAGLGSGKTYEAARKVIQTGSPALAAAKLGDRQGAGHHKDKGGNISTFTDEGKTRDIAACMEGVNHG